MKNEIGRQGKRLPVYRKVIPLLYILAFILMAFSVIANAFFKSGGKADYGLGKYAPMNEQWRTKDDSEFEIAEIDKLRVDSSDTVSIYYNLPEKIDSEKSIVFRSKNCYVEVFIGETSVYKTQVSTAPFYNHSPGTRWNVFSVQKEDMGKKIHIEITQAYHDGRAKVDNFYYGDHGAIILNLVKSKIFGCMISFIIIFVGILFLAAWIVLNISRTQKNNSLLWLGVFSLIAGGWCVLETNLLQIFTDHLQLIQVVNNMLLVLGGLPLFLYMDSIYGVFRYRIVRILGGLNIAYVLFAVVSQMSGGWDYHETLNGAIITYGIALIILVKCLISQYKDMEKLQYLKSGILNYLQPLGILWLGAGLFVDLLSYLTSDVLDRAFFIRIGLLGFVIFFGAGNIYQMIMLVQKGMETEFISNLAYQDGLTGAGNRTAYMEKLQRIEKEPSKDTLAIVMFDINNLKWINDTFGHKTGDDLITNCSELINKAFSPRWEIYRIGGDEFVGLLQENGVEKTCKNAIERLSTLIREFNDIQNFVFPVAIAAGSSFCKTVTKDNIEIAEKEADHNMYKNKEELKKEMLAKEMLAKEM